MTPGGGSAIVCAVDDIFRTSGALAVADGVWPIVLTDRGPGLQPDDGEVVLLAPRPETERLASCLGRGYRFVGTTKGDGCVRVWNESPK